MPGAGRLGDHAYSPSDKHSCSSCPHVAGGAATSGSHNVLVNNRPILRVNDAGSHSACCGDNQWRAVDGAWSVLINGLPAHRRGDRTQHCGGEGQLISGSRNVIIGNHGKHTKDLSNSYVLIVIDPMPLQRKRSR